MPKVGATTTLASASCWRPDMDEFTRSPRCFTYKAGSVTYQGTVYIAESVFALAAKKDPFCLRVVCDAVYRCLQDCCRGFRSQVAWNKIKWIDQTPDAGSDIPPKEPI